MENQEAQTHEEVSKQDQLQKEKDVQYLGLRVALLVQGYSPEYTREIFAYAEKIAVGEYAYKLRPADPLNWPSVKEQFEEKNWIKSGNPPAGGETEPKA